MNVREALEGLEFPKESLDVMDFIMEVEDKFDIVINDGEMAEMKTIEDLITLVEGKMK